MIRRLIILLLIVGCGTEPEDVYGCIDSNAVNYSSNATVSDSTCEYSVYGGYPDFETICGMDEFGNPTDNIIVPYKTQVWIIHNDYPTFSTDWYDVDSNNGVFLNIDIP